MYKLNYSCATGDIVKKKKPEVFAIRCIYLAVVGIGWSHIQTTVQDQQSTGLLFIQKFHSDVEIAAQHGCQSKEDIYKSSSIYLAHKLNQLVSEHLEIIASVSVGLAV